MSSTIHVRPERLARLGLALAWLALGPPARVAAQAPLREIALPSRALGEVRHVWVAVPPNYGLHHRRLPLTIVLDGDDRRLLDLAVAAARYTTVLDAFDPDTPEQIVVGVESHDRGRDFGSNAAAMRRFLEGELLPMLARTYRVAGPHVLVGHSLAGAFALDVLCEAPATLHGVVAVSPALAEATDATRLAACLTTLGDAIDGPEHAVFLAVGARARDGTEAQFRPHVLALARALDSARAPRLGHRLLDLPDVSHARTPLTGVPAGLAFVTGEAGHAAVDSVIGALLGGRLDPLAALDTLAAQRLRRGEGGPLPVRWRHMAALLLTAGGRAADAARVARDGLADYPERLELYDALAAACATLRDAACAREAARRGIAMAARREDLGPIARAREARALRGRWLADSAASRAR